MRHLLSLLFLVSSLASGEEWQASNGQFKAMLLLSANAEQIYDAWNSGPANGVKIQALRTIAPGVAFEAIVIFSNCTPNSLGNCQIAADWTVTTLSGALVGEAKDAPLWMDIAAPRPQHLQISENGLGLVASKEHDGYVFKVRVKDMVSGRSVELKQRATVVAT